ncbi:hypothetical protein, partial [Exiguobacterium sp. E.TIA.1]|uniref:hypothetical protein n=1 Tax=Exiguobacterium sp. E.TIA.1 TaxID=2751246 RepID=UPI001BEB88CE
DARPQESGVPDRAAEGQGKQMSVIPNGTTLICSKSFEVFQCPLCQNGVFFALRWMNSGNGMMRRV